MKRFGGIIMEQCDFCGGANKELHTYEGIKLCPYCYNSYYISTDIQFRNNPKYNDIKHINNMMNLLENRINNK